MYDERNKFIWKIEKGDNLKLRLLVKYFNIFSSLLNRGSIFKRGNFIHI